MIHEERRGRGLVGADNCPCVWCFVCLLAGARYCVGAWVWVWVRSGELLLVYYYHYYLLLPYLPHCYFTTLPPLFYGREGGGGRNRQTGGGKGTLVLQCLSSSSSHAESLCFEFGTYYRKEGMGRRDGLGWIGSGLDWTGCLGREAGWATLGTCLPAKVLGILLSFLHRCLGNNTYLGTTLIGVFLDLAFCYRCCCCCCSWWVLSWGDRQTGTLDWALANGVFEENKQMGRSRLFLALVWTLTL